MEKSSTDDGAASIFNPPEDEQGSTTKALMPPVSFAVLLSVSFAMQVLCWASARQHNLWILGFYVATVAMVLVSVFYLYYLRLIGARNTLLPASPRGWFCTLLLVTVAAAFLLLVREFTLFGGPTVAYSATAISAAMVYFFVRNLSFASAVDEPSCSEQPNR